jgi:hypothetical protein
MKERMNIQKNKPFNKGKTSSIHLRVNVPRRDNLSLYSPLKGD